MSSSIASYKTQLIERLWMPSLVKFSETIKPRIKRKQFRALSLTAAADEVPEIQMFLQSGLVFKKRDICLWTYTHIKKLRLEVSGARVLVSARYENTMIQNSSAVSNEFPFEILNLDFVSQDPLIGDGRLEAELESIEATFRLQSANPQNRRCGFSVAYTTLLDEHPINASSLIQKLNSYHADGWPGIPLKSFNPVAVTKEEKIELIQRILVTLASKYGYRQLGFSALTLDDVHSIVVGAGLDGG
jgi:hypothetical protein